MYTVNVIDSAGCTSVDSVMINEPVVLTSSIIGADASCSGGSDGAADLTVTGGTTPYSFLWSNSATTEDISNLTIGTYTVIITDTNGCTAFDTVTINNPISLTSSISGTDANCKDSCDGTATVTPSGGTPPYNYSWNTGQIDSIATGLCAGLYNVNVIDINNCSVVLNITINEPLSLLSSISETNVSCNSGNDGAANVIASGGTPPYSYLWSNAQTTTLITGLTAGTYYLTVTDSNNCITIDTTIISEPSVLTVSNIKTDTICGEAYGLASASANGGTPPYTYVWSNGDTTAGVDSLVTGQYTVTVSDSNGCSTSDTVTITNDLPWQPVPICLITVDTTSTKNVIVWEKPITTGIDSFRILRELTTNNYLHIGSVTYSDLSVYIDNDPGINPNITSYRYKMSVIDTCGNESDTSDFHKTIHLGITIDINGKPFL
ncbi:SprB repeat-containing protein, partial [bacterium AH-315-M05]|nr:SprB repeat-containing protein [bacterium AH-315-M05]